MKFHSHARRGHDRGRMMRSSAAVRSRPTTRAPRHRLPWLAAAADRVRPAATSRRLLPPRRLRSASASAASTGDPERLRRRRRIRSARPIQGAGCCPRSRAAVRGARQRAQVRPGLCAPRRPRRLRVGRGVQAALCALLEPRSRCPGTRRRPKPKALQDRFTCRCGRNCRGWSDGRQVNRPAKITLRRVNDVSGSTEAQRRWHIEGSTTPRCNQKELMASLTCCACSGVIAAPVPSVGASAEELLSTAFPCGCAPAKSYAVHRMPAPQTSAHQRLLKIELVRIGIMCRSFARRL